MPWPGIPSPAENVESSVCGSRKGSRVPSHSHTDILAFEQRWPAHSPERDERIRQDLGITPIRYAVLLLRAASSAEGIAVRPMTARTVRERAARRAHAREARFIGAAATNSGALRATHRVLDKVQTPEGLTRRSA